jgi:hypothetical protein
MDKKTGHELADFYERLYEKALDAAQEHCAHIDDLEKIEQSSFPEQECFMLPGSSLQGSKIAMFEAVGKTARNICTLLCMRFKEEYKASRGVAPEVDAGSVKHEMGVIDWNAQSALPYNLELFSPLKTWGYLEEHFGGDAGAQSTYRKAARQLLDPTFSNIAQNRREYVKDRMCITVNVDARTDIMNECKELDWKSLVDIQRFLNTLQTVAHWAGIDLMLHNYWSSVSQRAITSREIVPLADALVCQTYFTKFVFKCSPELSHAIERFLIEFSPQGEKS